VDEAAREAREARRNKRSVVLFLMDFIDRHRECEHKPSLPVLERSHLAYAGAYRSIGRRGDFCSRALV
jgi:hypothetical protein